MSSGGSRHPWGTPPWKIDFEPRRHHLPKEVDVGVIGGGFTGLAAAAWMKHLAPEKSVAVFEAARIGEGASGRTGGIVLADTAAGDKPGLGDVLAGFQRILGALCVHCDLELSGAWEIARHGGTEKSPLAWNDSGMLRVTKDIPGGSLDPGKLISGLGREAQRMGAQIFERCPVRNIVWPKHSRKSSELILVRGRLRARQILIATNALSLGLSGMAGHTQPRLTLAAVTAPIRDSDLESAGLRERKSFYTSDLPYLWGRLRDDNSIVWGAGLVAAPRSGGADRLERLNVRSKEPRRLFALLHERIRRMHPAFAQVRFTHHWGGPILFRENWAPVFEWHRASRDTSGSRAKSAIVLGAYAGHGVALSSYLAAWAVEALLGRRELPAWGRLRD